MKFIRAVQKVNQRSAGLKRLLHRLEALVDWEIKGRIGPDGKALMRVSALPAKQLLDRLGNPQTSLSVVHVSGSKGKGSVATMIAAGLREAPFTTAPVATYTSPHVEEVNERIRIDGVPIADEVLERSLAEALEARQKAPTLHDATWFDVISTTGVLGMHYSNVKWAVVEVGLGGRLDSTNVHSAPVSVITNVHLEHAEIIGPDLCDIAYEKAGIIAPSAHCICGLAEDDELAPIFAAEASKVSPRATVHFCPPAADSSLLDRNLHLARKALEQVARIEVGAELDGEALLPRELAVAAVAELPARLERFEVELEGSTVSVVLDGAHTKESVTQVLAEARSERKPVIVLGLCSDKNRDEICEAVALQASHVFATCAGEGSRYVSPADLEHVVQRYNGQTTRIDIAEEAVHAAIKEASERETHVIVIGSLYLAGRVRARLRELDSPT